MVVQVTFDAKNPRRLADFWAFLLHYRRDDPPEGFTTWEEFADFHGIPEDERENQDSIVPIDGNGPRLYFQKVPEPKTAKNRVHLDVPVAPTMTGEPFMSVLEARADELESYGATRLKRFEPSGINRGWIVMADPEGNEFCLV